MVGNKANSDRWHLYLGWFEALVLQALPSCWCSGSSPCSFFSEYTVKSSLVLPGGGQALVVLLRPVARSLNAAEYTLLWQRGGRKFVILCGREVLLKKNSRYLDKCVPSGSWTCSQDRPHEEVLALIEYLSSSLPMATQQEVFRGDWWWHNSPTAGELSGSRPPSRLCSPQ